MNSLCYLLLLAALALGGWGNLFGPRRLSAPEDRPRLETVEHLELSSTLSEEDAIYEILDD